MAEYVLELENICKEFYGNPVLKNVSLKIRPGEIRALLGENGAGKSTLMNILFGMPVIHNTGGFTGEIKIDGEKVAISSPFVAMAKGLGMVHQEFMLLPGFTAAENIKLNREPVKENAMSRILSKKLAYLDLKKMGRDARQALDKTGMTFDEWMPVAGMPVGYMQFVEIAREIDREEVRLLILDEPTAVLTESEAEMLLKAMRRLSEQGIAILFITHRLDEVLAVAHHITMLRDGQVVGELPVSEAKIEKLAELMVGRKIEMTGAQSARTAPLSHEIALAIEHLAVKMPGEEVKDFSIQVRKGEILGIGGLAGHGKIGVANGVMGLYPATGKVTKEGREIPLNNPAEALKNHFAFVSEDRRGVGLLLDESIALNICMTSMQSQGRFLRRLPGNIFIKNDREIKDHTERMIRELDIRCRGPEQMVRRLSGGNQQKICLAKAFTLQPEILFVSEPTRGIDVGAKKLVLDILLEFNRKFGVTIVMTSSELAELRRICDRIAIVYEGKLVDILPPDASDVEFGLVMAGKGGSERLHGAG